MSVSVLLIVGTATVPDFILPVPFGFMFMSMFVSQPVASSIGQVVVAALLIVNSFTAEAITVGNLISSFSHWSEIFPPAPDENIKLLFNIAYQEVDIFPLLSIVTELF